MAWKVAKIEWKLKIVLLINQVIAWWFALFLGRNERKFSVRRHQGNNESDNHKEKQISIDEKNCFTTTTNKINKEIWKSSRKVPLFGFIWIKSIKRKFYFFLEMFSGPENGVNGLTEEISVALSVPRLCWGGRASRLIDGAFSFSLSMGVFGGGSGGRRWGGVEAPRIFSVSVACTNESSMLW